MTQAYAIKGDLCGHEVGRILCLSLSQWTIYNPNKAQNISATQNAISRVSCQKAPTRHA